MAGFEHLGSARCVLLTTYRRDGEAVATPVWFGRHQGGLVVSTGPGSGKVKRLRANPAVTVAPCTQRGTPTGDARPGRATVLAADDAAEALRDLRAGRPFGLIGRLFERRGNVTIFIEPDAA